MATRTEAAPAAFAANAQRDAPERAGALDRASAAFGLSAAVTILFNTVLAWVKDAYDPLNTAMAHVLGHHWTTHGVVDVVLFLVLGAIFMNAGVASRISANGLVVVLVGAVVVAGLGLAGWFLFV